MIVIANTTMKPRTNFSTLFCLILVSIIFAQGDITQSQSRDGNEITVNCESIGNGEIEIRVVSLHANGSKDTETFVDEPISSTVATFTVTPLNEKAAYCEVGGMSTDLVYFGAIPILKPTITTFLAIVGREIMLVCPYERGTASDHIHPYHHIWFNTDISNSAIAEEFNRTLNAFVSKQSPNVSTYTCALRMQECSACEPVVEYPPLKRPQFKLTKVVVLSIEDAPDNQTVSADSSATFECAANGTSIEIKWTYNGDTYTANDENVTSHVDLAYVRSMLKISSPSNGSVICIVRQSFDGTISSLNNKDFSNTLPEQIMNSTAELIVTQLETTSPPTTMPTTTAVPTDSPPLIIAFVCLGIAALIAVTVTVTVVVALTCHYHYKYKRNSTLGRFLSRAVSRPSNRSNRANPGADLPSNGDGIVSSSAFQPASDYHDSTHTDNQHQEQIYNASQFSKSSGGSYSGLSGVSNQELGAAHKMPNYCATEVSGGSFNAQSSITNDGLLAPPHAIGTSRSQRSSNVSDGSNQSQSKAAAKPRLTQEVLSQHMQKATSIQSVYGPQSYGGYRSYQLQNNLPQHHSDNGFFSHQRQYTHDHMNPPLNLLPTHSPAGATVDTNSPYVLTNAPFPHCQTLQNEPAPFPSEHTNDEKRISEETIETVLKSLMHNKHCRIPKCQCYKIQELYKDATGKQGPKKQHSSSSESSDTVFDKRKNLYLPLSPKNMSEVKEFLPQASRDDPMLHPHYHRGKKTRVRSSNPRPPLERRRSKSVDLSPLGECSESSTKTPKVGGSLIAGTPVCGTHTLEDAIRMSDQNTFKFSGGKNMQLSSFQPAPFSKDSQADCYDQGSMSADDLPTLCLNDCPFVSTPREETKHLKPPPVKRLSSGKPVLSPIGEKSKEVDTDESDTSSRSDSPPELTKTCSSDHDADSARGGSVSDSIMSHGRLIHWETSHGPTREISQGYHSETLSSEASVRNSYKLKQKTHRNLSSKCGSDHSQRSTSPAYETVVTVSDDGNRVHTTEC